MYVCIGHVCVRVCVRVHVVSCVHVYVYVCACVHVYVYMCACVSVYVCACVHVNFVQMPSPVYNCVRVCCLVGCL